MKISVEGAEPHQASLVVVLLHGAGASALDFLSLSQDFEVDEETSFLAPQALNRYWYELPPGKSRGFAEPYFTLSVQSVLGLLQQHSEQAIFLVGFAEGAGVVAELLTKEELPASVKAAWLASGGLLGTSDEWPEPPRLNLPVLVSGLSRDRETLEGTARHFERRGAKVECLLVEGEELHIASSELALAQKLLSGARR